MRGRVVEALTRQEMERMPFGKMQGNDQGCAGRGRGSRGMLRVINEQDRDRRKQNEY